MNEIERYLQADERQVVAVQPRQRTGDSPRNGSECRQVQAPRMVRQEE